MLRKHFNKSALCSLILLLVFAFSPVFTKAETLLPENIRWKAMAILLDGINTTEKYSIPVTEAGEFIRSNSRFEVQFFGEVFDIPHTYTFYDCTEGLQTCVLVNKWDLDPSIWESVPTRDFYMLLWDTAGNPPLQAGGTWGVSEGVFKGGLSRPYITIPVDPWWFNNEPFEGFSSRAAQIMTQGKIGKDRGRSHFLIFTTMFSFDILPKYHANHNRWQEERYWQR